MIEITRCPSAHFNHLSYRCLSLRRGYIYKSQCQISHGSESWQPTQKYLHSYITTYNCTIILVFFFKAPSSRIYSFLSTTDPFGDHCFQDIALAAGKQDAKIGQCPEEHFSLDSDRGCVVYWLGDSASSLNFIFLLCKWGVITALALCSYCADYRKPGLYNTKEPGTQQLRVKG